MENHTDKRFVVLSGSRCISSRCIKDELNIIYTTYITYNHIYYINIIYHILYIYCISCIMCIHTYTIYMYIVRELCPQRVESRYHNTSHKGFKKVIEETVAKLNCVRTIK